MPDRSVCMVVISDSHKFPSLSDSQSHGQVRLFTPSHSRPYTAPTLLGSSLSLLFQILIGFALDEQLICSFSSMPHLEPQKTLSDMSTPHTPSFLANLTPTVYMMDQMRCIFFSFAPWNLESIWMFLITPLGSSGRDEQKLLTHCLLFHSPRYPVISQSSCGVVLSRKLGLGCHLLWMCYNSKEKWCPCSSVIFKSKSLLPDRATFATNNTFSMWPQESKKEHIQWVLYVSTGPHVYALCAPHNNSGSLTYSMYLNRSFSLNALAPFSAFCRGIIGSESEMSPLEICALSLWIYQ